MTQPRTIVQLQKQIQAKVNAAMASTKPKTRAA
jgi:hypothetical protein